MRLFASSLSGTFTCGRRSRRSGGGCNRISCELIRKRIIMANCQHNRCCHRHSPHPSSDCKSFAYSTTYAQYSTMWHVYFTWQKQRCSRRCFFYSLVQYSRLVCTLSIPFRINLLEIVYQFPKYVVYLHSRIAGTYLIKSLLEPPHRILAPSYYCPSTNSCCICWRGRR